MRIQIQYQLFKETVEFKASKSKIQTRVEFTFKYSKTNQRHSNELYQDIKTRQDIKKNQTNGFDFDSSNELCHCLSFRDC